MLVKLKMGRSPRCSACLGMPNTLRSKFPTDPVSGTGLSISETNLLDELYSLYYRCIFYRFHWTFTVSFQLQLHELISTWLNEIKININYKLID